MCKICIFAGTTEGRVLAQRLAESGARATVCVATEYGEALIAPEDGLEIHAGRMDAAEMEDFLRRGAFSLVVDATHPYAAAVTENIRAACAGAGVEYLRLLRAAGASEADGIFLPDAAACADYLKGTQGNILLATGSKELPVFCADEALRARIYARVLPMRASLEICEKCGVQPSRIIAMQGPFSEEMNCATLKAVRAAYLVTKDGGARGGYEEKKRAAARAGARLLVIGRPAQIPGMELEGVLEAIEARFGLTRPRPKVMLAGIGPGSADCQTLGLLRAVREADCLIGARRMLDAVDGAGKPEHVAVAASEIADFIRGNARDRRFVVLLSGDTGFYSGAKKLAAALDFADVEILPGVGSLSYFCARLKRPWEDVRALSLHGRECEIVRELRTHPAIFALVGGAGGAKRALERLREGGLGHLRAHVGERLGYPEERVSSGSIEELSLGEYDDLSVILAENPDWAVEAPRIGLPDEAFERGDAPMTKSEVRCLSVAKLMLAPGAVVYDVGSGSGSVTVEAAMNAPGGRVYAIERDAPAMELTKRNVARFHLENVEFVRGSAPEALADLPAPTHAFIGGSAGNLKEIIDCLIEKNPDVRIVANAVTLETIAELTEQAKRFEQCEISQVSVSRARKLGGYHLMTAQNPVYIFSMQRQR